MLIQWIDFEQITFRECSPIQMIRSNPKSECGKQRLFQLDTVLVGVDVKLF